MELSEVALYAPVEPDIFFVVYKEYVPTPSFCILAVPFTSKR